MIAFRGMVWRILDADRAGAPCAPARAPEGRFHHSGQVALYASFTAEGAGVAIRRYVQPGDPSRVIVPLRINATRLRDLRALPDPTRASVVWQDLRAAGQPAPTWALSDAARAAGAQGMMYPSRSRPELTHLVLFQTSAALVAPAGPPLPWPSP
ncbi:MAG: RES family NAD+ phosphorylase [Rhodobacteraceae bacterium]|nr:RES family NAD+ phosphorylase [Paracoccaceae bacterium]